MHERAHVHARAAKHTKRLTKTKSQAQKHVYKYKQTHTHKHTHTHRQTHTNTHKHTQTHTNIHKHTQTHTRACANANAHVNTNKRIYNQIHTKIKQRQTKNKQEHRKHSIDMTIKHYVGNHQSRLRQSSIMIKDISYHNRSNQLGHKQSTAMDILTELLMK